MWREMGFWNTALTVAVQGEGADDVLKEMWQRKLKSLRCVAQLCRWGEARCKSGNAAKQAWVNIKSLQYLCCVKSCTDFSLHVYAWLVHLGASKISVKYERRPRNWSLSHISYQFLKMCLGWKYQKSSYLCTPLSNLCSVLYFYCR